MPFLGVGRRVTPWPPVLEAVLSGDGAMGTPTLMTWPDPGPFQRAPQTLWGKTGLGDFSFILFCLSRPYFRESTCAHVRAEKGQREREWQADPWLSTGLGPRTVKSLIVARIRNGR